MTPDALLERLSSTFRAEIGPAIDVPYAKTQAFMASVVTEKLARQLRLAAEHAAADRADLDGLWADLDALLGADSPPAGVVAVAREARQQSSFAGLCPLVEALYAARGELGEERFAALLGRVRVALRARLDRQMAYAA